MTGRSLPPLARIRKAPAGTRNLGHALALAAAVLVAAGGAVLAQAGGPATGSSGATAAPRAVLELFTSQGCSSCPAADRLLGEMAKDPSLVTLSLSVDYWDYIGWKDTLALSGHTARQRAYSKVRGDREVYTPQMVVNGQTHVLGSDRGAIEDAIAATRRMAGTLSVPVSVTASADTVTVTVPPAGEGRPAVRADVWLCPVSRAVPVTVERGENRGKVLTYHNVVRGWIRLGEWSGEAGRWSISRADFAARAKGPADAAAVLLQARGVTPGGNAAPGAMLGAATAALP